MANEVRVLITAKDEASAKLKGIEKVSLGVAAGFAAVGAASLKMAGNFERDMDQVGAVLGATEKDMKSLRGEALKIGADTSKSAGEAAAAMEELAAGGRSVAQIMGGEARAAVALAEAGNYDLAESARTMATTMDIWKNSTINTTDVVNRLAGAANASRFGVDDMSQAIAAGGGVAAAAGVDFQDFSSAVAATASSFNSGSDAGTSFKTFITSLTGNSEQAKGKIKELGLEFYTAQGALKPMSEIVGELNTKLAGLSQEQQTVALKTIFGNDAFRTAAGLMQLTAEEFEALSRSMGNTNAAEIAKQRMDNLAGSMEELKGSLETVAISIGTKAVPAATELADAGVAAVNAFGQLPDSTQNLILLGGAAASVMPLVERGAAKATKGIGELVTSLKAGKLNATAMAVGIGALAIGLDTLSQKATGVGILERVFGDVGRAHAAADALREWDAIVKAAGPNADQAAVAMDRFQRIIGELPAEFQAASGGLGGFVENIGGQMSALTGLDREYYQSIQSTKEWEETVKTAAAAMQAAGATNIELAHAYRQLPPEMKKAFDEATNIERIMGEQAFAMESASRATDGWMGRVQDLVKREEELVEVTPRAKSATEALRDAMLESEDAVSLLDSAVENLVATYSAFNPVAEQARLENILLGEELDDLKLKGDDLTKAEKDRIKVIEDTIAKNDLLIKGYDDNAKAMEDLAPHVTKMIGKDGFAGLGSAMNDAGRDAEEQVEIMGLVAGAYHAFSTGDQPLFLAKMDEIKRRLDPAEWREVTTGLGEDMVNGYLEGANRVDVAQEMHDALLEPVLAMNESAKAAGLGVGMQTAQGYAAGLSTAEAAAAVEGAARGLVAKAIGWMQSEADAHSPSRRAAAEVGLPIAQGVAEGMLSGKSEILDAAGEIVAAAIGKSQAEIDAFIATIGKGVQIGPDDWGKLPGGGDAPLGPGYGGFSAPPKDGYGQDMEWDDQVGGWVTKGNAGSYGAINGSTFKPNYGGKFHTGQGQVVVNIGTVYARDETEASLAGGDLAYAMLAHGVTP